MKYFVVAVTLIFIFNVNFAYSQNITSRLRIENGGSVYFNINSLEKYAAGLQYNNWTKVSVYYIDTTATGVSTGSTWKLSVRAMAPQLSGDASNLLDLETLELEANTIDSTTWSPVSLSNVDQVVATGVQTPVGVIDVYITYYCGQSIVFPNNLLGKKSDYYYVDLLFTLEKQ